MVDRALLAQDVERAIDVGGCHFHLRALDRDRREIAQLDLRIDLEHRGEFEGTVRSLAFRLRALPWFDARIAGDAQVLFAHRLVEARLHGVGNDVGADGRAILLHDHLERHLAGTESRAA